MNANKMNKLNDFIFYCGGLYEVKNETDTQYCLKEFFNIADTKLANGWIDKKAPGIGDRIPGNDWIKIQTAMIEVYENAPKNFDPLDFDP